MSITLGDAILYLSTDDARLNAGLNRATGQVGGWLHRLAGTAAAGAAGLAIGAATAVIGGAAATLGAAFRTGMALDSAFDTLRIRTGAVGEELEGLQEDFRAVLREVPDGAAAVSSTMADLHARLGLTGGGLRTMTTSLLTMSRLMGGDAAANAGLLARVMGDWSVDANLEDSATLLDELFVASQMSGAGIEGLMQKVVQFGAPMRLMGFSLREAIAMFAKWERDGVNAELVMGSLRIAAGNFARSNVPLRDGLMETQERIRSMTDESAALALGMEVFGARAGPDMVAAIREGRFEIEDMVAAMAEADGAIGDTADATDDWQERLQVLRNRVGLALEPMGMRLMDAANAIVDRLLPAFDDLAFIFDERIMPVFDEFMQLFDRLLETDLSQLLPEGIGERLAGLVGPLRDLLMAIWEDLGPVLAGVGEFLSPIVDQLGAAAGGAVETFLDGLRSDLEKLGEWWDEHGETVSAIAGGLLTIAGITVGGGLTMLFGLLDALFMVLQGDWEGGVARAQSAIEGLAETVLGAMGSSLAQFRADWERTFNLAWELGNVIGERIRGIFLRIKAAIDGVIQSLRDLLPSFRRLDASQLPPWIRPGSPTPFEIGLRGIADASDLLARRSIPTLAGAFAGPAGPVDNSQRSITVNNPSFRDGEDLWAFEQTLARALRGMG